MSDPRGRLTPYRWRHRPLSKKLFDIIGVIFVIFCILAMLIVVVGGVVLLIAAFGGPGSEDICGH